MRKDGPAGGGLARGQWPRLSPRLRGLKVQIVLWTVLPLSLVLIGVGFTGVYSHEQAMRALVQERDQALAVVSAGQVLDLLRARAEALEGLAAEQAFHHQEFARQRALLAEAGDLNGLFAGDVALVDEAGNLIVATADPPVWVHDERPVELARRVMARQDVSFTPLSDAGWTEAILLLGVPVTDENSTAYGVLAGPVSLSSLGLEALLGQVQAGEHGVVYLVDGSGQILARSPLDRARTHLAGHTGLATALQDDGVGATLCLAPDGERMTLAYAPVGYGDIGWRVLIEEPWQEVIGPVLRYSQFMPLVAALAVVISLLTLYYGVRAIVRPLQALGQQAERVAWGDFAATGVPVGGVEEIEDLRRTLDQMAARIQSYQSGMHDYIAAITRGQEEERKRLARELHDETAQALIALGQRVEMAQKLLPKDPARAAERLAQVREMLAEAVEAVRRFSRDLRPIYLEDLGFIPALEMLTREADQGPMLSVDLAATGRVRRLSPDLELAAYRIVQEALNNVIQHAGATHTQVQVDFEAEHLALTVQDDGQGFEAPDLPDALARGGHFGLMGIQERALLYGGQLSIRSEVGKGTTVVVRLPYASIQRSGRDKKGVVSSGHGQEEVG
jgi:signal transduction histidine kinase